MNKKLISLLFLLLFVKSIVTLVEPIGAEQLESFSYKINLGVKDTGITDWSGSLSITDLQNKSEILDAKILNFWPPDSMINFQISPKKLIWKGSSSRQHISWVKDIFPISPYTILVTLKITRNPVFKIHTDTHSDFSCALQDFELGEKKTFLDGQAQIERAVPAHEITDLKNISAPLRYNNFPSVCAATDGSIYIAYISTVGTNSPYIIDGWVKGRFDKAIQDFSSLAPPYGGDQIMLIQEKNGSFSIPECITEPGRDIHTVNITADIQNRRWVVWSEQVSGNWDLYMKYFENQKWSPVIRVTTREGQDINPVLACDKKGTIYLVWQGFRGNNSDILYVTIDSQTKIISDEKTIGKSLANEWEPSIAISQDNSVAVAWDTYQKGDYDVYYALCKNNGTFSQPMPAAASLRFEARPSLSFDDNNRLWIAWEETGENWGKDVGTWIYTGVLKNESIYWGRSIRVKCFDAGNAFNTQVPIERVIPMDTMFLPNFDTWEKQVYRVPRHYVNYPVLIKDSNGGICLMYRHQENIGTAQFWSIIWANYLLRFDGKRWTEPVYLSHSDGQIYQKPAVTTLDNGCLAIAYGSDFRVSIPERLSTKMHTVWLAKPVFSDKAVPFQLTPAPDVSVAKPEISTTNEAEDVLRIRNFRSDVGTKPYQILRGDFHRHSTFSKDGGADGSIADLFRYALDAASLDWVGCGDHAHNLSEYAWYVMQKYFDVFLVKNTFLPMFSYERSTDWPYGHRNFLFAQRGIVMLPYLSRKKDEPDTSRSDTEFIYRFVKYFGGISVPHTIGNNQGNDWRACDPIAEPVVEIYQGARNSYEYLGAPRSAPNAEQYKEGMYWSALKKGLKLGIISSSDHKSTHISYAMVYVENPSRQAVVDALKKRHSYGATDNIILEVKMGEHLMGDVFESKSPARLEIRAIGTEIIKTIDIIKNCEIVYTLHPAKEDVQFIWEDPKQSAGESYYYVRVEQENGELAWGSPMWITLKNKQ